MTDKVLDLPIAGRFSAPEPIDIGAPKDGRIVFQNWRGAADRPEPDPPAPLPPQDRVGFAIAGLGRLALGQILPAFAACKLARPVALISGTPAKARTVAAQYGIPDSKVLGYDEMANLRAMPEVQAVYIVTPNGLHLDHVSAAASAGKHVLCEKPMANTADEARRMIGRCATAEVKLMIAYRCQYENYNKAAMAAIREGKLGKVRIIEAANTQMAGASGQWRMKGNLAGGGALPDIGLYCLNGARAMLGEDPTEVYAKIISPPDDERYAEVEETICFMLRFPSGAIANCTASYGAHESKDMRLYLDNAVIELENAFAYQGQRMRIRHRQGDAEAVDEMRLGIANQFASEIDHFAKCILENTTPDTSGDEGLRDHEIMDAIYLSARENMPVKLSSP